MQPDRHGASTSASTRRAAPFAAKPLGEINLLHDLLIGGSRGTHVGQRCAKLRGIERLRAQRGLHAFERAVERIARPFRRGLAGPERRAQFLAVRRRQRRGETFDARRGRARPLGRRLRRRHHVVAHRKRPDGADEKQIERERAD